MFKRNALYYLQQTVMCTHSVVVSLPMRYMCVGIRNCVWELSVQVSHHMYTFSLFTSHDVSVEYYIYTGNITMATYTPSKTTHSSYYPSNDHRNITVEPCMIWTPLDQRVGVHTRKISFTWHLKLRVAVLLEYMSMGSSNTLPNTMNFW